jgi:hypothetical protein
MKVSELNQLIENIVSEEIKKTIIKESEGNKFEVYHITCEGEPLATFHTEDEAKEELPKYKKSHKGELIIEKGVYESHGDMIDKLDEMGEQLEEKENSNMENQQTMEGNAFSQELLKAKEEGKDKFEVDGKEYDVEECWKQLEEEEISEEQYAMEEEEECKECGDGYMEEELHGDQDQIDMNKDGKIGAIDFKILRSKKKDVDESAENCCNECGAPLNEEGMCSECGSGAMYESKTKKKTLRLTESELVKLIEKMVNESSIPTDTTKAQAQSKKDNDSHLSDVDKKMKDYLTIPGNNNNEFPQQNKKGESVKVEATSEEEEKITDEKGRGMENLNYDHEPSKKFKERLKKALEGDSTMGNGQDAANVVKSDLGKKVEKEIERKEEDKENEPRYKKEPSPVRHVNESKEKVNSILKEEIEKMKSLSSYNKKTQ